MARPRASRPPSPSDQEFKLDEDDYLDEIRDYIVATYGQHYAKSGTQTITSVIEHGEGIGYCKGNIRKYLDRYGIKGNREDHRRDLLKLVHFGILLLIAHDHG